MRLLRVEVGGHGFSCFVCPFITYDGVVCLHLHDGDMFVPYAAPYIVQDFKEEGF